MLGDLGVQVVEVDLALLAAGLDDDDLACPAITALAALVPCALAGIRQTSRWLSPLRRW